MDALALVVFIALFVGVMVGGFYVISKRMERSEERRKARKRDEDE